MIHLVHGFNVSDRGENTFSRLKEALSKNNLAYRMLSYPWTRLITLTTNNRWAVEELVERVNPGDGFIGHSNGCWIGVQAAEMEAPISWMILVNPALHPNHEIPGHVKRVFVFYCEADTVVRAGSMWRRIVGILPWRWRNPHGWGAMGARGYTGTDPRVTNIKMPDEVGHSGAWQNDKIITQIVNLVDRGFYAGI